MILKIVDINTDNIVFNNGLELPISGFDQSYIHSGILNVGINLEIIDNKIPYGVSITRRNDIQEYREDEALNDNI